MANATNRRLFPTVYTAGMIALLSIVSTVLNRQNSVRLAYATEPAPRGGLELMAVRGGNLHLLDVDKEAGSEGSDPWTSSQVRQAADLAKELSDPKSKKPLIIYVGFETLYRSAHIPGALFHGPGAKPAGLEDLKKWARDIPRGQPIVLYCGCCPWNRCPNIRPAFRALREMGFAGLKVLFLESDLATDWVQKGFPVQRGK